MPRQKRQRADDLNEEQSARSTPLPTLTRPKKSTRSNQLNMPQVRTQATKTVPAVTISEYYNAAPMTHWTLATTLLAAAQRVSVAQL